MKTKLTEKERVMFERLAVHYDAKWLARHFKIDIEFAEKLFKKYNRKIGQTKVRKKIPTEETVLEIYDISNDENNTSTITELTKKYNLPHKAIREISNKERHLNYFQKNDLKIVLKHLNKSLKNSPDPELKQGRDLLVKVLKEYY